MNKFAVGFFTPNMKEFDEVRAFLTREEAEEFLSSLLDWNIEIVELISDTEVVKKK